MLVVILECLAFRHAFLNGAGDDRTNYEAGVETALDGLAAHFEMHLDLDALVALTGRV